MMNKQILIVDDDPLMRRSLSARLSQADYATVTAGTTEEALAAARIHKPDLILLDVGLPDRDGLVALREFRQLLGEIPVIFVTARRRELDQVVGLELGADDYITKPFDMDVLLAHIRAVLRRTCGITRVIPSAPLVVGDLYIDPQAHTVQIAGDTVSLSPKEFDLLLMLASHAGRVLTSDELLTQVWGAAWIGEMQTLYVHVRWLREKIEKDPAHPHRIVTVRGVGYKLCCGS